MPQIFRIGAYHIFFWINEGVPIEPIHVHVSEKGASSDSTKLWITKNGKTIVANNHSRIPEHNLNTIRRLIESRSFEIMQKWQEQFGEIKFYC